MTKSEGLGMTVRMRDCHATLVMKIEGGLAMTEGSVIARVMKSAEAIPIFTKEEC
jgi:hypothetical protein